VDSFTQLPYATISNPANQDIGWETTKMINGGIDAGFFNNCLTFSLDICSKKTTDIFINQFINSAYGFQFLQFNGGTLAGNGVDLGLTGRIFKTNQFSWASTINFS